MDELPMYKPAELSEDDRRRPNITHIVIPPRKEIREPIS